jgi:hypothetical protein
MWASIIGYDVLPRRMYLRRHRSAHRALEPLRLVYGLGDSKASSECTIFCTWHNLREHEPVESHRVFELQIPAPKAYPNTGLQPPADREARILQRYHSEWCVAAHSRKVRKLGLDSVYRLLLGSVRRECLDHLLILHEKQLHRVLNASVHYFNRAQPHQSIRRAVSRAASGPIISRPHRWQGPLLHSTGRVAS